MKHIHVTNLKRTFVFLTQFILLGSILVDCTPAPAAVAPTRRPVLTPAAVEIWPTAGWRSASPEEQGMDPQKLAQMADKIQQEQFHLDSLLVVHNGYLVFEQYYGAYQQDTRHELYSCTKSFVSTLVGMALDQGRIASTGLPVLGFFPGRTFANPDPQKEAMTLEDLLTMRSGLDWVEGDPSYQAMYMSRDWVKYMLDKPMVQKPGSEFLYCSGCTHVLSAIVQQTTGMNTLDFAKQDLFAPLGITNLRWDTDAAGIPIGGWGLQLTPRDMAKLGYLFLRNGEWDGQQIISAAWVENATRSHTATDSNRGYGYQWWTYPSLSGYTALGRYGQTIFVIPWADLVIVTTANLDNHDEIFKLIEQYIVPAVQ